MLGRIGLEETSVFQVGHGPCFYQGGGRGASLDDTTKATLAVVTLLVAIDGDSFSRRQYLL